MVRRDEEDRSSSASRCSSPAGASPASVSTGAPRSRPQASVERPVDVKPAASTDSQSESRAGHVAAKAMSAVSQSGDHAAGLGGVWGAARVQGDERNTRGPSAQSSSGQRGAYKPTAKSRAAQRASEGVVVPLIVATNNATGGKGLCGGHVEDARTREGMAGTTGPTHPDHRPMVDKVRQLQRRLWVAA